VLRAGASGYVLKEAEPEELLSAIHMVSEGQVYLSPSVTKALLESVVSASANSEDEKYSSLTRREKDVLKLAVSGRTNRDIAEALFLSIRTVEKYRQGMMRKLDLGSREDLEKYARRKGILDSQS
jgi:two-component system response regulator NreC